MIKNVLNVSEKTKDRLSNIMACFISLSFIACIIYYLYSIIAAIVMIVSINSFLS